MRKKRWRGNNLILINRVRIKLDMSQDANKVLCRLINPFLSFSSCEEAILSRFLLFDWKKYNYSREACYAGWDLLVKYYYSKGDSIAAHHNFDNLEMVEISKDVLGELGYLL